MYIETPRHPGYNLYLSHSWNYNHAYKKLNALLGTRQDFSYNDFFVSENKKHSRYTERQLYETIRQKMKHCQAILIMCGVYTQYSRWLNKEIILGKDELRKPIIAIQPFEPNRTSLIVKQNADRIVDWNLDLIINTIEELV
jgi:glutaminase